MDFRRKIFPTAILLLLVPLVLMSPLLLTGRPMFWGTVSLQFVPWSVLAARIIQSGQLPLWNPLVGMGAPLLANYQSGLLYPPNWLVLFSAAIWGAGGAAWVQTLLVALHLVWAGLGMLLLARQIGISPFGQVICGLSFALSGYLVSRSAFISINAAVTWAPWFILSVTWLARGKTTIIKVISTGMVVCVLLLTGHAQTAWYAILFSIAWLTIIAWQDSELQHPATEDRGPPWLRSRVKHVLLKWLALFISVALGACLAAAQLIPTAELLLQSQRSRAVDFEHAMTYSFWPWRFLTLLAPGLFGSPVSGDYWGYGNYWEDALYIGVLPLLLAIGVVVGTLVMGRKNGKSNAELQTSNTRLDQNALVIFLLGTIIVSFVLALGKNTPIFPWLYFNIPTFAAFQAPTRFSILAVISLTLLAGMGADRIKRPAGRALYWTRLGTAGAGAIALGAGLAWYFLSDISPTFIGPTALFGLFAMCSGLLVLSVPAELHSREHINPKGRVWECVLLLIVGFDLILASWNLNPGITRDFYSSKPSSADNLTNMPSGGRLYLNPDDEYALKFNRFMRFDSYNIGENWSNLREVHLPNINILDGVASVNNFDPLVTARYARWMDAVGKIDKAGDTVAFTRLLNLMGVGSVEYLNQEASSGVGFKPVAGSKRVRWVHCAEFALDGEDAWGMLNNGKFNFDREVVIESRHVSPALSCTKDGESAYISIIDEQPNWIKMSVSSPDYGWLVLSDIWYPGWKAEIDGERTPIFRANYLFRAVAVPAGEHTVTWRYSPRSFWLGLLISAFSWIFVVIFWILILKRLWRNR